MKLSDLILSALIVCGIVVMALPEGMQTSQCQYCAEALMCHAKSEADTAELKKESEMYENSPRFKSKIEEASMQLAAVKDQRYHSIIRYLKNKVMMKGQSVLDLGCASGAILKFLGHIYNTSFGGHSHFAGVELTPGWVRFAKEDQPEHQWFNADATEFIPELGKTPFDVILMNDSMEHIVEARYGCLFGALTRYSKPGTVVYMHVPTAPTQMIDKGQYFENVVPQNVLLAGMACAGFELERFEYDMQLNCGSPKAAEEDLHYSKALCRFNLEYPKYYHVIFRRPVHQAISQLLPACSKVAVPKL
jgi:SAM-dependent methyltransferase